MKKIIFVLSCFLCINASAQTVKILTKGTKTGMRGLSVVDDKTIWVSGSGGQVGRSLDSGNTWKWMTVKGFEKMDFRDIEAFNETTAVIMGIDAPAYILRTNDGGENWQVVFKDTSKGMFLDAMEFWNEQAGIVIGDPINGKFFIGRTFDGGNTWQGIPENKKPIAGTGEACFAASGTNIRKLTKAEAIFITGGLVSNVHVKNKQVLLPLIQGTETTGANSIAVKNKKTWMVVGGDFNTKDSSTKNAAITFTAGKSWSMPAVPPTGYRSCVEYIKKKQWITCGLNGVDISNDNGKTFTNISKEGFHVVRKSKKGSTVFFAGQGGRIGKLVEEGK
ncbi:MAG: oxidoreductase [Rhizobacter sp.]|nr:oxidoreductase [Ferruginibacter sp.]